MEILFPIIGWIGTFSYIIAYFLLAKGVLKAEKPIFHILNLIGGLGLVINSIFTGDLPSIAVNGSWGLIALYMIYKIRYQGATKEQ